jgi:uncharacterized protein with von Willebrand factor type A (vWA) domain
MIAFCRLLRERELLVSPTEVVDALRTADTIDLSDPLEMKLALRTVLTASRDDLPVFDATFDEFWRSHAFEGSDDHFATRNANLHGHGQVQARQATTQQPEHEEERADERHEGSEAPQYSPIEVLSHRDFITFAPDELADLRRAIALLARKLALQTSRRYRGAARRGQLLDLRGTFRRNIKYGGTLLELARKQRRLRKPRIVLLCDVSRSMELYATFLLQFIYALQNSLGHVESFVFSTRLSRVTEYFKTRDIYSAVERMAREVPDWASGTRIGDSLRTFNRYWAPRVLNRHTIVLILSDGLDSGEAGVLGAEMERIERGAARVIWLNPMVGDNDGAYRPVARTMRAALQHVAVFASAHNLESLEALGRTLTL